MDLASQPAPEVEVSLQAPVPVADSDGTAQVADPSDTVTVPDGFPDPGSVTETLTATQ